MKKDEIQVLALATYELLEMCGRMYDLDKETIKTRIDEISKKLNLTDFLHSRIENLSTGQTQRVNIARCLIHNPKYYILDEATTGLDIISSQIILNFIKEEKKFIIETENIILKFLWVFIKLNKKIYLKIQNLQRLQIF